MRTYRATTSKASLHLIAPADAACDAPIVQLVACGAPARFDFHVPLQQPCHAERRMESAPAPSCLAARSVSRTWDACMAAPFEGRPCSRHLMLSCCERTWRQSGSMPQPRPIEHAVVDRPHHEQHAVHLSSLDWPNSSPMHGWFSMRNMGELHVCPAARRFCPVGTLGSRMSR